MPGVAAGEDGLVPRALYLLSPSTISCSVHQGLCSIWHVYILRSKSDPKQEYTGATQDLKQRLADHNAGKSPHTSKYLPWVLAWYCAFPEKPQALEFETYLKSHSGRAFAKKRLTPAQADPEN